MFERDDRRHSFPVGFYAHRANSSKQLEATEYAVVVIYILSLSSVLTPVICP